MLFCITRALGAPGNGMYEELARLREYGVSCGVPRVVIGDMQDDDQVDCVFPKIGQVQVLFQTYPHAPYVVFSECFVSNNLGNVVTFQGLLALEGTPIVNDFQGARVIRNDKPHDYIVLLGARFTYTHFVESGCIWDSRAYKIKKPADPWSD